MITIDFETYAIDGNTSFKPPIPVGVAIKKANAKGRYYGWGHPTKNNTTYEKARAELLKVWPKDILFHHSKFDVSVAIAYMDLPMPAPRKIHDTQYLLFLNDPYSQNLSLKPSAERLLDWAPEEQDALTDWIMAHTDCPSRRESGAWIAYAPGDIVGTYAIGDVDRTKALYDLLMPLIREREMEEAYQREQDLMPITYYSERKGVRVNTERLGEDLKTYEGALIKVENRLLKMLNVKELEFSKNERVADALEAAGLVKPEDWVLTPTGRRSTSKDNFPKAIKDAKLLALLRYRGAMAGCLQTFARPWHELASEDGRLHTTWNQVRTHEKDATNKDSKGSRTGRLSASKPSLMNVTNELKIVVPRGLPAPPLMRRYLLPEDGHVWLKRDFSGQEVRILAHFEDGTLMEAYVSNPNLDPHQMALEMIATLTGVAHTRKDVKITAFSIVYGSGNASLAEQLGCALHEAAGIKAGYYKALPGVKKLQKLVSGRGRAGKSIRTWGGREYYTEPPKIIRGRKMDFSYKLLNYLIQGSAADQTKQCVIDWDADRPADNVFMATVHDEINISVPADDWERSMKVLKEVMDQDLFDVPMRSEGFYGPNWFDMEACA